MPNKITKDLWQEIFRQYALAIADANVLGVSNTAKQTLVRVATKLFRDPDYGLLGANEKARILRGQYKKYAKYQAERLVRTESNRSANHATMESAASVFPKEDMMKTWIHNTLVNEREWHKNFEPKTIPYNDYYLLEGDLMFQPGDGSAKNIINCRCTISPHPSQRVLDKEAYDEDFTKLRDSAERSTAPQVQRYYEREYNKNIDYMVATGNINYEDSFNYDTMRIMYRDMIVDIAVIFALWYADNIENYLKK
tara:strand:- start:3836 stop:4594 length:759 start_codon:yes stop_codon:yes gene_type:complete